MLMLLALESEEQKGALQLRLPVPSLPFPEPASCRCCHDSSNGHLSATYFGGGGVVCKWWAAGQIYYFYLSHKVTNVGKNWEKSVSRYMKMIWNASFHIHKWSLWDTDTLTCLHTSSRLLLATNQGLRVATETEWPTKPQIFTPCPLQKESLLLTSTLLTGCSEYYNEFANML